LVVPLEVFRSAGGLSARSSLSESNSCKISIRSDLAYRSDRSKGGLDCRSDRFEKKKTEVAAAGLATVRRVSGVERARLPARLGARRLPATASYGPAHWFGRSVI
jgi:hypothetical protein